MAASDPDSVSPLGWSSPRRPPPAGWSGRRPARRRQESPGHLPDDRDRRDCGDPETRARWQAFHSLLISRVLAEHPDRYDLDLMPVLLPTLHSACCWTNAEEVSRWLDQAHGVAIGPGPLRRALAFSPDAWHLLWRLHLDLPSLPRTRRSAGLVDL